MDLWLHQIIQWALTHVSVLWGLLVVLNIIDVALTVDILKLGGHELNPLARRFIALIPSKPWFGLCILKVIGFWLMAMCVLLISQTDVALCLLSLCALYTLVVSNNFCVLARLEGAQS